jgi:hypothetical protein
MRSPSLGAREDNDERRAAAWVWWGLVGAIAAILVMSLIAMLSTGSDGVGRNRGPGSEAAPGAQPTRDIDRSRAP